MQTDEKKHTEAELEEILNRAEKNSDPFSIKPRHWAVFFACLAFLAACVVLLVLSLISTFFAYFSMMLFVVGIIEARFPKLVWSVEAFFIRFKADGDITPSDWWFFRREISILVSLIAGIILFLIGIADKI